MSRRRRIASKHSRFTTSDPRQLTADSVRKVRRGALADVPRGRRNTASIGFSLDVFSRRELSILAADKQLAATWNRVVRNFAAILQRRARELSRKTYDTGLFSSGWTAVVRGSAVKLRVILANVAPYGGWVHRSGERVTVVNRYIRPMVREETERFLDDFTRGQLARSLKARILAQLDDA